MWFNKTLYSKVRQAGKTIRRFPTGNDPEKKRLFGDTQYCPHCKEWKDTFAFDWKREGEAPNYTRINLQRKCSNCRRIQQIKKYSKDPHIFVFRAIQLILQPSASEKKGRQKSKLTMKEFMKEWMKQFEKSGLRCPKTGQMMTYKRGEGEVITNISIDRLDNKKDYEKGNVQFVCLIYNKMKLHHSEDIILTWCRHIVENAKGEE